MPSPFARRSLLMFAACCLGGGSLSAADGPLKTDSGGATATRIQSDVVFAEVEGVALHCDIYSPADASEPRPAVVVIHGGAWASGDKWMTSSYASALADAGIVAMSVNYRLAPEHKFPAQLDDIRAALLWLANHAEEYGVDTCRIGLYGYSAGAHLSCMVGTLADAEWAEIEPTTLWSVDDPRWERIPPVQAIVGGGTPCDFREMPLDNTAMSYFFGGSRRELPDLYRAASPAAHVSAEDVPTLYVHGSRDLIVPAAGSRATFHAQVAAGVCSEYLPLEGPGHLLTYLHPATKRAVVGFLTHRLNQP